MPNSYHHDDRGNRSWMRVALSVVGVITIIAAIFIYRDWRLTLYVELGKEVPDYSGITELFEKMMIGFVLALVTIILGKVGQKGFERYRNHRKDNEING